MFKLWNRSFSKWNQIIYNSNEVEIQKHLLFPVFTLQKLISLLYVLIKAELAEPQKKIVPIFNISSAIWKKLPQIDWSKFILLITLAEYKFKQQYLINFGVVVGQMIYKNWRRLTKLARNLSITWISLNSTFWIWNDSRYWREIQSFKAKWQLYHNNHLPAAQNWSLLQ